MTNVKVIARSPKMAAAIKEFETEVEPAVLQRLYAVHGRWSPDPLVPDVYGYLIDGTNHALAILYAEPDRLLDWELDDTIL